jgi:predicted nucleic acid-binding protein
MIVIADTSPLNYLVLIQEVDLLPLLFGQVIVPPSVCRELKHPGASEEVRRWIAQPPSWLEVRTPTNAPDALLLDAELDQGESDAILLALELAADQVIMDDMDGRREAERRRLAVTGTVGILRAAAAEGLVNLKDALQRLRRTNFHLSQELYDQLIADVG